MSRSQSACHAVLDSRASKVAFPMQIQLLIPGLLWPVATLLGPASGLALDGLATLLGRGRRQVTAFEPYDRQLARLETAVLADPAHEEVYVAWRCAQDLRAAYSAKDTTKGRRRAEKILDAFHTCPIPEIARLGRTLRRWRAAFLAYFTTGRSSNGGTEAVNGIIELHRRLARGFRNRDNYRLRMLLAAGGLTP